MKKAFKLAAMAVAIVGLMAACKQNAPETADATPIDTMMVEEFTDTVDTVEAVAEEEPVKTTAKKTTAKKEEPTTQQKIAANADRKSTNEGSMTLTKADGTKVSSKSDLNPSDATLQKNNQKALGNVGRAAKN